MSGPAETTPLLGAREQEKDMSCERFEEQIAMFAGGDLRPEDVPPLDDHLRVCGQCRDLRDALLEDWVLLKRPPALDDGVRLEVRARVMAAATKTVSRRPTWKWAIAASIAAVVMGSLWTLRVFRVGQQTPQVAQTVQVSPPARQAWREPVKVTQTPTHRTRTLRRPFTAKRPTERQPAARPELDLALLELMMPEQPRPKGAPSSSVAMKLVTDDPNVIILWMEPTTGEANE